MIPIFRFYLLRFITRSDSKLTSRHCGNECGRVPVQRCRVKHATHAKRARYDIVLGAEGEFIIAAYTGRPLRMLAQIRRDLAHLRLLLLIVGKMWASPLFRRHNSIRRHSEALKDSDDAPRLSEPTLVTESNEKESINEDPPRSISSRE